MTFKEISPQDLKENVFKLIGKDWLVVCGEQAGKVNAMTASWGGMGVLWNLPVAFIFIRPQRYTKEFVDGAKGFTLSVFEETKRDVLNYLGTVSGRKEDKIKKARLTTLSSDGFTYFAQARLAFLCRKLYEQDMKEACFIDHACAEKCYPQKDYHTLYVAAIEKVLVRQ